MANFQFRSVGSALQGALEKYLVEQEVKRRQQFLDGLLVEDRMQERARQEMQAQRQAAQDAIAAEDRARRIAGEDRNYADQQARQRIEDERYESGQQQKILDRKDADAQRYLNTERGYHEDRQKREFEASESAKQRASSERIVRQQMAGKPKAETDDHNPAAITIDSLDELSARINTQDGVLARAGGVFASAAAKANYDDDTAEYQALLRGAVPLVARRMGHTGVLTKEDVDSTMQMFPSVGDSKALRDRKIARIRKLMNQPAASGDNTGGSGDARVRRYNPATGKIE
jgi:hypothetical protein